MATFCGLAAVLAVCVFIGMRFGPDYGEYNCCTGRALQSREEEAGKAASAKGESDPPNRTLPR
jgi:hypothetical protein